MIENKVDPMSTLMDAPEEQNLIKEEEEEENDNDGAINEKSRLYSKIHKSPKSKPKPPRSSTHPPSFTNTNPRSKSQFNASKHNSHLLHAMVGLDRYPNYLSRWSLSDIESLEDSIMEQLMKVKKQKEWVEQQRKLFQEIMVDVYETLQYDNEEEKQIYRLLLSSSFQSSFSSSSSSSSSLFTWKMIQENILDPRISKAIFNSKMFKKQNHSNRRPPPPTVEQVLSGKIDIELDAHCLEAIMDQEMFDVYSFPLFRKEFCKQIHTIVQKVQYQILHNPKYNTNPYLISSPSSSSSSSPEAKNSNNSNKSTIKLRPIDLDTIGLGWINTLLLELIIRPISRHLFFKNEIKGELDWRQGYVSSYAPPLPTSTSTSSSSQNKMNGSGSNSSSSNNNDNNRSSTNHPKIIPNSRLVPHTDDSEVTLNLCLGDVFTGGNVQFHGLRGTSEEGISLGEYEPIIGRAVLHAGRHLHEVTKITSGNRFVLIVWARSWSGIRSNTCPCCWLNRRGGLEEDDDDDSVYGGRMGCIMEQKWN